MPALVSIVDGNQSRTDLLNFLPVYFRDFQNEACSLLRRMSITCNNVHKDPELAKEVLLFTSKLKSKSADLAQRLADDLKKIEEFIEEDQKDEARLTSGGIQWEITKKGARLGDRFVPTASVTGMRWGILVSGEHNSPRQDYSFVITNQHGGALEYLWQTSSDLEKNDRWFFKLVGAAMRYLLPAVLEGLQKDFDSGHSVQIGECAADKIGVKIKTKGWFSTKVHTVPWSRLNVKIENGMVVASDQNDRNISVSMPLRTTTNAVVLQFLAKST